MLLVDFNLAEHLEDETRAKGKQIDRTVSCVLILYPLGTLTLILAREHLFILLELLNGTDLCHPLRLSFLGFPTVLVSMLRPTRTESRNSRAQRE
jgi:hypothetical protein